MGCSRLSWGKRVFRHTHRVAKATSGNLLLPPLHSLPATLGRVCPDRRGLQRLPNTTKMVDFVPQPYLFHRAALTITHADLTMALGSPNFDVPMVAILIDNEQPDVAASVA